jgi:hypothetical protein
MITTIKGFGPNTTYNVVLLPDFSIKQAKEKIFAQVDIPRQMLHPHLFALRKGNRILHKGLLYDDLDDHEELSLVTIFDSLENENVMQLLESAQRNPVPILEKQRETYIDLTEEDLIFALKFTLFVSDPVFFAYLRSDIEGPLNSYLQQRETLRKKYADQDAQLARLYDALSAPQPPVVLRVKAMTMNVAASDSIGLDDLFQNMELNEHVLFLATQSGSTNAQQPSIRVFNGIFDKGISEKDFKSWFLNEKKKTNSVSYKKIKNVILVKIMRNNVLFSLNVFNNGQLTLSALGDLPYDKFTTLLSDCMEFVKSELAKYNITIDDTNKEVSNITATFETSTRISRQQFESAIKKQIITKMIFEPKDSVSTDTLSFWYKDQLNSDRKGLTVTLQDNPERIESSLITVNAADSLQQLETIQRYIHALASAEDDAGLDAFNFDDPDEHILRPKSNIKQLKEQGIKVLSTNCQKQRQPVTGDSAPLPESYDVVFEKQRYTCQNPDYPYPGFTNENIVCCFKKDQRRKEPYIRNMQSSMLEVQVQPSNFSIRVISGDTEYDTFAIKSVSGHDHPFHFIADTKTLVPITNPDLVQQLEERDDVWLEPVSLSKLITSPPKNKCNFPPDFSRMSPSNVNQPCEIHAKKPYFGYNLNSFPCCFDKKRPEQASRKRKETNVTKQHIITTDKILESGRLGTLPRSLQDSLVRAKDGTYYRMGVVQNKSSLLNVINLATDQNLTRDALAEKVGDYFSFLNIQSVFSEAEFKSYILNQEWNIEFVHNFLLRTTAVNIVVLDILAPETGVRIICNEKKSDLQFTKNIIVLKRQNNYELLVEKNDNDNDVTKSFGTDHPVIQMLADFAMQSCVVEDKYPLNFAFDKSLSYDVVWSKVKVKSQVVNAFNKVVVLITNTSVPIPITSRSIIEGIEITRTLEPVAWDLLSKEYKKLSKTFKVPFEARAQVVKDNRAIGILTNFGVFIPILPRDKLSLPETIAYDFLEVDAALHKPLPNVQSIFSREKMVMEGTVYKLKKFLGLVLQYRTDYYDFFKDTALSRAIPLQDKYALVIQALDNIFKDYISFVDRDIDRTRDVSHQDISCMAHLSQASCDADSLCNWDTTCKVRASPELYGLLKGIIANDLLTDTKDFVIINNKLPKMHFSSSKENESLLQNITDVRKFVKQRTN